MCVCWVTQSCPILCNPVDCSPLGSSVHGIIPTGILEQVAREPEFESIQMCLTLKPMLFLLMYSLRLITILIYGVLTIPIFNEEKESEGKKYVSLNILVDFKTYPSYAGYSVLWIFNRYSVELNRIQWNSFLCSHSILCLQISIQQYIPINSNII